MTYYVPGTEEKDPAKIIMSLQQAHEKTAENEDNIAALQATVAGLPTSAVTSVATSGLATGGPITSTGTVTVAGASKSNQETGTSTSVVVTPGIQKHHPSATKAWANFTGSNGTVNASFGVTSVSRGGTGTYTLTFSTAFASASNYVAIGAAEHNAANTIVKFGSGVNKTTTTIAIFVINLSGTLTDPDFVNVCFYGAQ